MIDFVVWNGEKCKEMWPKSSGNVRKSMVIGCGTAKKCHRHKSRLKRFARRGVFRLNLYKWKKKKTFGEILSVKKHCVCDFNEERLFGHAIPKCNKSIWRQIKDERLAVAAKDRAKFIHRRLLTIRTAVLWWCAAIHLVCLATDELSSLIPAWPHSCPWDGKWKIKMCF